VTNSLILNEDHRPAMMRNRNTELRRRIHACHMRRRIHARAHHRPAMMRNRNTELRRRIYACHMRRRIHARAQTQEEDTCATGTPSSGIHRPSKLGKETYYCEHT
jgi:hypothetical protein